MTGVTICIFVWNIRGSGVWFLVNVKYFSCNINGTSYGHYMQKIYFIIITECLMRIIIIITITIIPYGNLHILFNFNNFFCKLWKTVWLSYLVNIGTFPIYQSTWRNHSLKNNFIQFSIYQQLLIIIYTYVLFKLTNLLIVMNATSWRIHKTSFSLTSLNQF